MQRMKWMMLMLAAGCLALGSGAAWAAASQTTPEASKATPVSKTTPSQETQKESKEVAKDRVVRGEVTAVEPGAKTLSVKVMRGKETETVGVDVPDSVKITQGKLTKTLGDIKVGDRVWMKYDRTGDKLVADQIRILKSGTMAAKSETSKKSY